MESYLVYYTASGRFFQEGIAVLMKKSCFFERRTLASIGKLQDFCQKPAKNAALFCFTMVKSEIIKPFFPNPLTSWRRKGIINVILFLSDRRLSPSSLHPSPTCGCLYHSRVGETE